PELYRSLLAQGNGKVLVPGSVPWYPARGQCLSEDPGRPGHALADRRGQLGRDGMGQATESLGARRATPWRRVACPRTSPRRQPPTWPGAGWVVNVERKGGLSAGSGKNCES